MSKRDPGSELDEFISFALGNVEAETYVGIDPGATGAVAFLCGRRYVVVDIPTMKVKRSGKRKRSAYNNPAIVDLFRGTRSMADRTFVCLEKAQAQVSEDSHSPVFTAFSVGVSYGMWPLFLTEKGFSIIAEPPPNTWKGKMELRGGDKETSRHKALSLFPKADILRKQDHNRAEALLLAEYGRRLRNGEIR